MKAIFGNLIGPERPRNGPRMPKGVLGTPYRLHGDSPYPVAIFQKLNMTRFWPVFGVGLAGRKLPVLGRLIDRPKRAGFGLVLNPEKRASNGPYI